jgi:hypothetical protein
MIAMAQPPPELLPARHHSSISGSFYGAKQPFAYQKNCIGPGNPGTNPDFARCPGQTSRARLPRKRGGTAMWISLFSVVTAIALAFALAAVVLESFEEARS